MTGWQVTAGDECVEHYLHTPDMLSWHYASLSIGTAFGNIKEASVNDDTVHLNLSREVPVILGDTDSKQVHVFFIKKCIKWAHNWDVLTEFSYVWCLKLFDGFRLTFISVLSLVFTIPKCLEIHENQNYIGQTERFFIYVIILSWARV